jgi:NADH dehydrogenase (ubiquinone) 1 beta subcomplex subunit 7
MPWNCNQERHDYEECQYLDFQRRVKELEKIKAERAAAQSS